ncbi:MAG TPA: hypothetical protein VGX16_05680 [Solirubrobacteraceae bacterium]|nr:hypothetical protein [Solirubrobacteraceae bacterium]
MSHRFPPLTLPSPSKRSLPYRSTFLLFAALTLPAALIAGCGSSSSSSPSGNGVASKSANEIVAATKAAADGASSVHVSGSATSGKTPLALDFELATNKGARGKITQSGLSFEFIEIGGVTYIKGDRAFYAHFGGSSAPQLFEGKWLKVPAGDKSFGSLGSLLNLHALLDGALTNHGALTKGSTATVNGQESVGVTDAAKGGTLYVATTGTAYPVAVVKTGAEGGKISFSDWGKSVALVAPASSIDISQLGAGH